MKVIFGRLERPEELAEFLQRKIGAKAKVEGDAIEIGNENGNVKAKLIKTYIKRYLYNKGIRKSFRIFVKKDILTLQMLEGEEQEEEEEET